MTEHFSVFPKFHLFSFGSKKKTYDLLVIFVGNMKGFRQKDFLPSNKNWNAQLSAWKLWIYTWAWGGTLENNLKLWPTDQKWSWEIFRIKNALKVDITCLCLKQILKMFSTWPRIRISFSMNEKIVVFNWCLLVRNEPFHSI